MFHYSGNKSIGNGVLSSLAAAAALHLMLQTGMRDRVRIARCRGRPDPRRAGATQRPRTSLAVFAFLALMLKVVRR